MAGTRAVSSSMAAGPAPHITANRIRRIPASWYPELAVCQDDTVPGMRNGRAMTEDAVISVLSAATRIACRQAREMERHLKGLHYMGRLACGASSARITRAS